MCATIRHRGPDGTAQTAWNAAGAPAGEADAVAVGLGHTRLSILDLTPAGAQPMRNEDGSIAITYNGEFYDYENYHRLLEERGHTFRSRSDTETILHLYEEFGIEQTLKKMNGMFAFALWDAPRKRMVLARDRLGKKPLYYVMLNDGTLLFASEIKALLVSGLVDRNELDLLGLDQFWRFGHALRTRTVLKAVRRLLPGHYAVWEDGTLKTVPYWDCSPGDAEVGDKRDDDLVDELESLLCDATRLRLVSDVPVGLFLSGGVDSALLAVMLKKVLRVDIPTFTLAFREQAFDESNASRKVADLLGLSNQQYCCSPETVLPACRSIAAHFDEPFGDSSAIPTFFLSRFVRRHVTVALSGDGADEVFAGYDQFRDGMMLWGGADYREAFKRKLNPRELYWLAKLRRLGPAEGFSSMRAQISQRGMAQLYSHAMRFALRDRNSLAELDALELPDSDDRPLGQMQALALKVSLPEYVLRKVDMMTMATSLECRSPYLDYRIVEFAARLPSRLKMDPVLGGKAILKKLLARHLPPEVVQKPKRGFCAPWEEWCIEQRMIRSLHEQWRQLNHPLLRPDAADYLFPLAGTTNAFRLWNAFSFLTFAQGGAPSLPD